jgi:hypothetical protein
MVAAAFTTGKRSVNYPSPLLPSPYTPLPLLSNLKRNNLGLDNYALYASSLGTMVSTVEHDVDRTMATSN